jgi:branched-chain amino acid transport system substrate-binding protein
VWKSTGHEEDSLKARRFLWLFASLLAVLVLVAAACGGDDEEGAGGTDTGQVGGEGKTVKIVSDLPLQGSDRVQTTEMNEAIRFVLEQAGNMAGPHTVEFEEFDDATAATGAWDEAKCAENARTYAEAEEIVAVIGTYNSGCAAIEIPILNEAGVAMISPANTYTGLTKSGPGTEAGEPDKYFPAVDRNYVRVVASDDNQGKIGAAYMQDTLGVTKVFILDDRELYGKGVADAFESSANDIGLEVVGHEGWDKNAPNYRALMTKIQATGADGIYIGGISTNNGGQLVKDKVAIVGDNEAVKLLVSDGFVITSLFEEAGEGNLEGAFGTAPTTPPENLTGEGAQFAADLAARLGVENLNVYTIYAAAAAQVAVDAIGRSDGSRADVIAKLFETNVDTVVGSMSFNAEGDPENATESVYQASSGVWAYLESATLG